MVSDSSPHAALDHRSDLHAFARKVESLLAAQGIRLTMGGEPTFVPQAPQGAEWQTAALGPTKLGYARQLARALLESVCPGGVVLETLGKHYPGEPLPRWALLVQWMPGREIWRNVRLLKSDTAEGAQTPDDAHRFVTELAAELGLPDARPLALQETDADSPRGWVLPLDHTAGGWQTDDWSDAFVGEQVPLLAGDSPAGLRLPLSALGEGHLRRALTAEVRGGSLSIFVPPLRLDGYLALLGVLEGVVTRLRSGEIVLTGYAPPPDPALATIGLASDPGVLEVNLLPAENWVEFDRQLGAVYQAADRVGLCARKLQYNGREVGTGGGAHLVFGGPEGLLSPFFARPAFLPSIIRYWQHHPALSYAFTGSYLGPSSQAPRIDESTFEALYELEIACAGAENLGNPANLPFFDLLFRDLLMDRSGNTHRAEISVDKLWNPYAPNGRLGLVEFRAFETHPVAGVQSTVALFVRAILVRLLADPFREPFRRWGGELHDRFFLPAFVREDLADIAEDLRDHQLPFDPAWLRPAWEWRFPLLGRFALVDAEAGPFAIEFRQALEAWPLLGESPNAGTVARTVDASVDRIEARVEDDAVLERGLLLVNGYPCEFRPLRDGGAAAGIRYRAFYLTPSLQPHVPVHAPLLLEWVDRSTLIVVAAARWHVWNPRHAAYVEAPRDEAAAAARRAERWEDWPHTLGQARYIPRVDFPPEGRHTLDLRRYPAQAR